MPTPEEIESSSNEEEEEVKEERSLRSISLSSFSFSARLDIAKISKIVILRLLGKGKKAKDLNKIRQTGEYLNLSQ